MVITTEIKELIESEPAALATVMANGKPNVIGVAYIKVVGNKLLITDNFMTQTIKDIKKNPAVAVIVWNEEMEGYKLVGRAEYFTNGRWVKKVKGLQRNKGLPAKGAILIKVSKIIKSK